MFRAFADVQTADRLNLPRPRLHGDKATVIACPMSDEQHAIQAQLVARYEAIRAGTVKPCEDNALAITTDGRKLALDARLLSPTAADYHGSKINALVENVTAIWQRTAATRGTQLLFADLGIHPTAWSYAVYKDVIAKLVANGVPRAQIAAIGDADTDAKKQALFDKVRHGTVRILLGSTQKIGTGTNVQQRLVALHHLDAPWKPAEVEQRDGRIVRQGNRNAEVAIYRYVTAGSFDAYMWQALETKAAFIAQVMTGESTVRRAEDLDGKVLSYAEVKAIASGNPAVLTLAEADADLQRLHVLHKHHTDEQYQARRRLRELPRDIERLEHRLAALTQDMTTATAQTTEAVTIGMRTYSRHDALAALTSRLHALPASVSEVRTVPLGTYRGLQFGLVLHPQGTPEVYMEGILTRCAQLARESYGPRAILNAVERLVGTYEAERDKTARDLGIAQGQHRDYAMRVGAGFAHAMYLEALTSLRNQLEAALSSTAQAGVDASLPTVGALVERIKALQATHTLDPAPERSATRRTATIEEAIITRIRWREQADARPQPEDVEFLVSPTTPAPLPAHALERPVGLAKREDARRSPATRPQEHLACPEPWRPPQQLSLF
jgi:hypothetical protein